MSVDNHTLISSLQNGSFFHCFKRDSAGTFLPVPKGPLSASLSTETANKAVPDTCTCTCDFENINFENLF